MTIFGPKEDLDRLEASKCELTEEQVRIPIPALEGSFHKPKFSIRDPMPTKFHRTAEKIERCHDRKLLFKYFYEGDAEHYILPALISNFPKCCFINCMRDDGGYNERASLRFTQRGTIHVLHCNWNTWNTWYPDDDCTARYSKVDNHYELKDNETWLDFSHVRYTLSLRSVDISTFLHASNIHTDMTNERRRLFLPPILSLFESRGVKIGTDNVVRFITKDPLVSPIRLVNMLRKRFPDTQIRGSIEDRHGRHLEVSDSEWGYELTEWYVFTKKEEYTLNDFSWKCEPLAEFPIAKA